jgi:hypothetical protein
VAQGLRRHLRRLLGELSSEELHTREPAGHPAEPPHHARRSGCIGVDRMSRRLAACKLTRHTCIQSQCVLYHRSGHALAFCSVSVCYITICFAKPPAQTACCIASPNECAPLHVLWSLPCKHRLKVHKLCDISRIPQISVPVIHGVQCIEAGIVQLPLLLPNAPLLQSRVMSCTAGVEPSQADDGKLRQHHH